ncbi:MAG: hypothetical protein QM770_09780 [Tepidisphaeraceae bacterium]
MNTELSQLRIEKHHKASRHRRSIWPWLLAAALLVGGGVARGSGR